MTSTISCTFLQQQALFLNQAMLGVISQNFRMVSISMNIDTVYIQVILEHDSKEDREELEDCESEFEALQKGPIDYAFNISIVEKDIVWPDASTIVIYRRKE